MRYIAIIVLLVLNGVLIYLYYGVNGRVKKCVATVGQERSLRTAVWQQTLERDSFTLQLDPEMFNLLLYSQGSPTLHLFDYAAINSERATLFFFIPQNVCAACLDKELELLIELKSGNQMDRHVAFIAPQLRERNLSAFLSGKMSEYAIFSYMTDHTELPLQSIDFVVLFSSDRGGVHRFFATHKSGVECSKLYYRSIVHHYE